MIPPITMVGPWYVMFRSLGLDNTYTGLVLAHLALNLPIGIWLMSVFVREIPLELEEAARIDGCTTPQMLWRIVVPLVAPGLAATAVICFVFSWNEFAVALNLTAKQTATVPVAIARFAQEYEIKHGVDGRRRGALRHPGHPAAPRRAAAHREGADGRGDPVGAGLDRRRGFGEHPSDTRSTTKRRRP